MSKDLRIEFDDALHEFREFLRSQLWSDEILWLCADRVISHNRIYWVLRPEELASPVSSKGFYEACRKSDSSIRIDAIAQFGDKTLAWVEDYGGDSRMLNYGIATGRSLEVRIVPVKTRWLFSLRRKMNAWKGAVPILQHCKIPASSGKGNQARE